MSSRGASLLDVAILIVGEAPGPVEDAEGVAFVGESGHLLNLACQRAGLPYDVTRISNTIRCFPADSRGKPRAPEAAEIAACWPYLTDEATRAPKLKVIIPLGNTPASAMFGRPTKITKERGRRIDMALPGKTVAVIPSLHPAYILRQSGFGDPTITPEFAQLVGDLTKALEVARDTKPRVLGDYRLINSIDDLKQFTAWLLQGFRLGKLPYGFISVDVETDGFNAFRKNQHLASIQISWAPGKAVLIPVAHMDSAFTATLEAADVLCKSIRAILAEIPVVGQNFKFDFKWLYQYLNAPVKLVHLDTCLAHQHLCGGTEPNDLTYMAQKYLGREAYEDAFNAEFAKYGGSCKVPMSTLLPYGCTDADVTLQLAALFEQRLRAYVIPPAFQAMCSATTMWETYQRLFGQRVFDAIVGMEIRGIGADMGKVAQLADVLPKIIAVQDQVVTQSPFYPAWREALKEPNPKRWRLVRGKLSRRFQCPACATIEESGGFKKRCRCGQTMAAVSMTTTYPVSQEDCIRSPEIYRWNVKEDRPEQFDSTAAEFVYVEPNFNSHFHLEDLVYKVMGCPKLESMKSKDADGKRKTGTTEGEVLERLADQAAQLKHEWHAAVLNAVLNRKKIAKLYSTYVEKVPEILSNPAGVQRDTTHPGALFISLGNPYPEETIHTTFGQFTVTGRLSSKDPNMQNNPRGAQTREVFVSRHRKTLRAAA